jgi:AmpD protein
MKIGRLTPTIHRDARPADIAIDTIVIHSMANLGASDPEALADCVRCLDEYGVSAHYFIARDGGVWSLVPPAERAWHAGASRMPPPDNRERVNDFSIGIELLALPGTRFNEAQYRALSELIVALCVDYPIRAVVGHDDIAVPPGRKTDPGPAFDWGRITALQVKFPQLKVRSVPP